MSRPTLSQLTRLTHLSRTHRFASTKSSAPRQAIYFGRDVYWGKAWKNVYGTGLLYIPAVAAVMFWCMPIPPVMNQLKGVKKTVVGA
ncbi:eebe9c89-4491-4e10-a65e-1f04ea27c42f [Sclerotinia trifoliorum]|uniref:Eebe9c89-4491-4e10-a65e-1f04ea27c42f n=1 Tax=Sclerotinia trifoliorum TaxID=28548 RepID=A0A8H2ZR71_9HELO|nr:eebe9c89-4491-4e10-a65e-1f04ea27c42f [Sclerotinia trifoliorum]